MHKRESISLSAITTSSAPTSTQHRASLSLSALMSLHFFTASAYSLSSAAFTNSPQISSILFKDFLIQSPTV